MFNHWNVFLVNRCIKGLTAYTSIPTVCGSKCSCSAKMFCVKNCAVLWL